MKIKISDLLEAEREYEELVIIEKTIRNFRDHMRSFKSDEVYNNFHIMHHDDIQNLISKVNDEIGTSLTYVRNKIKSIGVDIE